ncbi:hypothetical protein C0Q70_05324 [Pomacea canaliculata]|uniref:C-type lectin domain-containing protein n=1 Tax=Pomacea canaliculata TaxID=400727 RepID=A0A2T7PKY8_POMCA|nr:hypothetical protein C0Q70_05324 [Pomacea canaliculata]
MHPWDPDAHSGFKLLFSFHNVSALPERLADNRWNCSVPHWSDFRQHFPCNLESDCVGGEDEADCPYTSDVCGQGFARMGQGCVLFVRTPTQVAWPEADMMCDSRDMALISASTPEKWDALYNLLAYRPNENVLVGLKRSYQSCVSEEVVCDDVIQCVDGTDELGCLTLQREIKKLPTARPPAIMDLSPTGEIMMIALNHSLPFSVVEDAFYLPKLHTLDLRGSPTKICLIESWRLAALKFYGVWQCSPS